MNARIWLRGFFVTIGLAVLTTAHAGPNLLDQPLPTEFNPEQWREIYTAVANEPASKPLQVVNPAPEGSAQAALLAYYRQHIEPRQLEYGVLGSQYSGLHLLLDSGLFRDEAEKKEISARLAIVLDKAAEFETNENWQNQQREFGRLAGQLPGQLAEAARRMALDVELNSFPTSAQAEVEALYRLDQEINDIANDLPAKDAALKADSEINQVQNAYYSGQLDFATASKQFEALSAQGAPAIGAQLIERAGDKLQQMATIRSRLAKIKGFKTWADYRVAVQADGYGPGLQTADEVSKFLRELLDATDVAAKRALRYAASKQNRSLESLRPAELLLLLPPAEFHVYGFFQRQNIEKIWRETMAASGFGEELTRRVIVDAFPRAGKQGHAYMSPARMAILLQPQVDGTTLDFIRPPDESELWGKPVTAIVQNFTDDDLGNVKTAFHEGGHGLDFASRREISGNYHSNGYSETHSTTMERFARDLEFLKNYAINAQGERPAPGKIEQYLREEVINELLVFRGSVIQSLFDIELWRHDYSKPGSPKLWERAIKLSKELALRQRFVPVPKDLVKMRGLSYFSTSHFYSGEVRYFGYVLAKVAAETVANHALDRLEAETGRRTLFQQPKLGPMLTQLYRYGTETKFPESIERFTGKTFSAVEFARDLNAGVHMGLDVMEKEAVSTACDNALATNRAPAP